MWRFRIDVLGWTAEPMQVFPLLGIVLCGVLLYRRLRPLGVAPSLMAKLVIAAIFGGALGSKLLFFIPMWIRGVVDLRALAFGWQGGSMFYGGFLGGTLMVALVLSMNRIPVAAAGDRIMALIPIGFILGKVGCFLAGCCFGAHTDSAPGMSFPAGSPAWNEHTRLGLIPSSASTSLPVHATQLYEAGIALVIFLFLLWRLRRPHRDGEIMLGWLVLYAGQRFFMEFLRSDGDRHAFGFGAFTDSQIVAIAVTLACAIWILIRALPTTVNIKASEASCP